MRYLSIFLVLTLALSALPHLHASKYGHTWYFGRLAGIDFNSEPPRALSDSKLGSAQASACISDPETGTLLFYSNAEAVYNREHEPMPNGGDLFGHISSSQGALIIPHPGNDSLYYLFTTPGIEDSATSTLPMGYSLIDMRLDSGRGDVALKNVPLMAPSTEKLTAAYNCRANCYWVLAHKAKSNEFHAWKIDADGLDPVAVVSAIGLNYPNQRYCSVGGMSLSPDGSKLAVCLNDFKVELFNFDINTGQVSNYFYLPGYTAYSAEFSPDSDRLYITGADIIQFDASRWNYAAVSASRNYIFKYRSTMEDTEFRVLQLAPDGRMYVARSAQEKQSFIGVINFPDRPGLACDLDTLGFDLDDLNGWRRATLTLPNFVDTWFSGKPGDVCKPPIAAFTPEDTLLCPGACLRLHDASRNAPQSWRWRFPGGLPDRADTQLPGLICFPQPGSYTIELIVDNDFGSDTARHTLRVRDFPELSAGPDLKLCRGDSVQLRARIGDDVQNFFWTPYLSLSDAALAQPMAFPTENTTYILYAEFPGGCVARDTVNVTVGEAPRITMPAEQSICPGDSLRIRATAENADSLVWFPAAGLDDPYSAAPLASPSQTTRYTLYAYAGSCTDSAGYTLTVLEKPQIRMPQNPAICRGQSLRLDVEATDGSFTWQPQEGLSDPAIRNPLAQPAQTTMYYLTVDNGNCSAHDSLLLIVHPLPVVDAGPDTAVCRGGRAFLRATAGAGSYTWYPREGLSEPDRPATELIADTPALYYVEYRDENGCTARDSLFIDIRDNSALSLAIESTRQDVLPGDILTLRLLLDGGSGELPVTAVRARIACNPAALKLRLSGVQAGSAAPGWMFSVHEDLAAAELVIEGSGPHLRAGEILRFDCAVFLAELDDSLRLPLRFTRAALESEDPCLVLQETHNAFVQYNAYCLYDLRAVQLGARYALGAARPNPAESALSIVYSIALEAHTTIEVFNSFGQVVARPIDEVQWPGTHIVEVNTLQLAPGVYFYRLHSGPFAATGRFVLGD